MPDARTTRRLAAILAADVVGYSRLMASDETGTLSALKRHRETVFDPAVAANNGRVFKLIGDGTLVEFGSVVDAVNCALSIQRTIAAATVSGPKITLRIGINLGDIIIDGDDVYGDGVNVAARLEPLAEHGGVCVSSIVNESVGNRIDVTFRDGGEVQVKNIDRPIRIWKWHPIPSAGDAKLTAPVAKQPAPEAKPQAASIAVLPFANMSGDAEQEYFSDGITEDIITDLSKIGGLVVIARNSTFAYKGRNVDIRTVGRDLGVRTVLEGSIRRAGNRVRITGQLIDADTGGHLWAERYDRDLNDIFAVQDEVTREIVGALKVTLTPGEQVLIAAPTTATTNAGAHDKVLRAREILGRLTTRDAFDRASTLLRAAVELDPNYAEAHAALAMAYSFDYQNRWTETYEESLKLAKRHLDIALAKDTNDAYVHYVAGVVVGLLGERVRAVAEFDRAVELAPNMAAAVSARGVADIFMGLPELAISKIERAIRLDPGGSQAYLHFLGLANFQLGNDETAAALFKERILLVPETDISRSMYAATLGHLGRLDEARAEWTELMKVNPRYSLDRHLERLQFARPQDSARIRDGLAAAGLPPA